MNRDKALRTTRTVEFLCHGAVWDFWDIILSRGAYGEVGYSVDELVDDALAFYVYLYTDVKDWGPRQPWKFRQVSWELMTGFSGVLEMLSQASEEVDEQLRDLRVHQLYIEHTTGLMRPEDKDKPYGLDKFHNDDAALKPLPSLEHVDLFPNALPKSIGFSIWTKVYEWCLSRRIRSMRQVKVTVSSTTWQDFLPIMEHYRLTEYEAVLMVLEQLPTFISLLDDFSDSFREDLFLRQMACRTLVVRAVEQANVTLDTGTRLVAAGATLAERLSVLKSRLQGGESLTDFLGDTELSDIRRERAAEKQQEGLSAADRALLQQFRKGKQ